MKPVFKQYTEYDYEAVVNFLIELNRVNQHHINWNWGRFEWMMGHPEFDKISVRRLSVFCRNTARSILKYSTMLIES